MLIVADPVPQSLLQLDLNRNTSSYIHTQLQEDYKQGWIVLAEQNHPESKYLLSRISGRRCLLEQSIASLQYEERTREGTNHLLALLGTSVHLQILKWPTDPKEDQQLLFSSAHQNRLFSP